MAPLDLDKYVEIARLCKYLPENDLKVRRGAGRASEGGLPSRALLATREGAPLGRDGQKDGSPYAKGGLHAA